MCPIFMYRNAQISQEPFWPIRIKFCTLTLWESAKQASYYTTAQNVPESHKLNQNFQIVSILYQVLLY